MREVEEVIKTLQKIYAIEIRKSNPFRTLIQVVLSHRTKDATTFLAQEKLLKVADIPQKILKLPTKRIQKLIYPVGFYRQKAKRIKKICGMLIENFNGRVPYTMEELMELPGVGPKSASIVLAYGFGIPAIAVDTHVNRISQRLGWVPKNTEPEKTQLAIEKLIPKKYHILANHLLVTFGKDICRPVSPHCFRCPIYEYCRYERKEYYKKTPKKIFLSKRNTKL